MSGDVQPRKRKDKKKKKDDLPAPEELRGTAAMFGEGDVLIHSQHEHGTGGHWCAKVIFFSLLAILITLIGLIILENRGLSELEASSVESRYTGVLEGWLEDAVDDHHDEHTLELKHPTEEEHDESEDENAEEDQSVELEEIESEIEESTAGMSYAEPFAMHDDDIDDGHDAQSDDDDGGQSEEEDQTDDDYLEHDESDDNNDDDDDDDINTDEDDEQDNELDGDDFESQLSKEMPYEELEESSEQLPVDSLLEEEEYEREQDEQRRAEEEDGHVWLKAGVGVALLVATQAVLRRAVAPAAAPAENEEEAADAADEPELTTDRRMTLVAEEPAATMVKKYIFEKPAPKRVIREPTPEEEEREEPPVEESDREEIKEEVIEKTEPKQQQTAKQLSYDEKEDEEELTEDNEEADDSELAEDVEIIDEEQIDDQEESERVEEEEISDVDDAELLNRLEAKYGKLPEPERYGYKKDGANMIPEEEWGEEPDEERWRRELDLAQQEMNRGSYGAALARAGAPELSRCARAGWLRARALDQLAEQRRDNKLLERAVAAYVQLIERHKLGRRRLREVAERCVERARFRGTPLAAAPAHRALAALAPRDPAPRNQLVVSALMANQMDVAHAELTDILQRWPDDRVALAHYGFVLKMRGDTEGAVAHLARALADSGGDPGDARFHYHLGDALLMLGRAEEARRVHERAAELGYFKSAAQRSLYNVAGLRAAPWWELRATRYGRLADELEAAWRDVLREARLARQHYEAEKEGLRVNGSWSQLELFARGREHTAACARAPVTCGVVRRERRAAGCTRGQVKFSALAPGTRVRAHTGPTNTRLRVHLALEHVQGAFLRVDQETRQWEVGKVLTFDDSFEHEAWHTGPAERLVLIVDVWHPDLSDRQAAALAPI